jgi:hypothetical protein
VRNRPGGYVPGGLLEMDACYSVHNGDFHCGDPQYEMEIKDIKI